MSPENAKLRVCRYLRKSRDDGAGETLEETFARHTRMTNAMAADRGFEIQHTYPEVVSGASIEERPQMQQLMQDLKDRKWDVVIVVDISRLSRGDGSDQAKITNAFKLTGTKCLSEYKLYDLSDADDLELFERKLQNSRAEYKSITKRLNGGVLESIREGYAAGGVPPYGLTCVGPKRKKVYETNDDFKNVESAFAYCHDYAKPTLAGLRRHMHSLGIPSPKGKEWWSKPALEYLIFNDAYIGFNVWGIHKTEPYLGDDFGEKKRKIISDDYIRVPAKWPAFLDPEYVYEARRRLLPEPHVTNNATLTNPLAGLLRCSKCGYIMRQRPQKDRNEVYYIHPTWEESHGCSCKAAPRSKVMDILLDSLQELKNALVYKLTDTGAVAERERALANISQMEANIEKSRKTLVDAYYRLDAGKIDEDVYAAVSEREKGKIARMEATIEELKSQLEDESEEQIQATIEHLQAIIEVLQDATLDPEQMNAALKTFIDHIDYTNYAPPRTRSHDIHLEVFLL